MEKYIKGTVLGHGTFGSVYKATDKEVRPQAPPPRGAPAPAPALSPSPPPPTRPLPARRPRGAWSRILGRRTCQQLGWGPHWLWRRRRRSTARFAACGQGAPRPHRPFQRRAARRWPRAPQTGQVVAIKKINVGGSNQVGPAREAAGAGLRPTRGQGPLRATRGAQPRIETPPRPAPARPAPPRPTPPHPAPPYLTPPHANPTHPTQTQPTPHKPTPHHATPRHATPPGATSRAST
jgi:serine/threonine protein kinase